MQCLVSGEQRSIGDYEELGSSKAAMVYQQEGTRRGTHLRGPDPADSFDIASQRIEHLGSLDKDIQFASNKEYSEHLHQTESRLLPSLLPCVSDVSSWVHPALSTVAPAAGASSADALLHRSLCRMDDLADALQASQSFYCTTLSLLVAFMSASLGC